MIEMADGDDGLCRTSWAGQAEQDNKGDPRALFAEEAIWQGQGKATYTKGHPANNTIQPASSWPWSGSRLGWEPAECREWAGQLRLRRRHVTYIILY